MAHAGRRLSIHQGQNSPMSPWQGPPVWCRAYRQLYSTNHIIFFSRPMQTSTSHPISDHPQPIYTDREHHHVISKTVYAAPHTSADSWQPPMENWHEKSECPLQPFSALFSKKNCVSFVHSALIRDKNTHKTPRNYSACSAQADPRAFGSPFPRHLPKKLPVIRPFGTYS